MLEKLRKKVLVKLRRNVLYEETNVPALQLISESESWHGALLWYIVFIAFAAMCAISVATQYAEFMDNPTVTDAAIVHSTELKMPNFSICLQGFPSLSSITVPSPDRKSNSNRPQWVHTFPPYVEF